MWLPKANADSARPRSQVSLMRGQDHGVQRGLESIFSEPILPKLFFAKGLPVGIMTTSLFKEPFLSPSGKGF